tara:strand:+ start:15 stop:401 length:387 start_codon:yes stop_codon:yes gene_type:complete
MRKKVRKRIRTLFELLMKPLDTREELWICTNWYDCHQSFKVFTSFKDLTLITKRELRVNGKVSWFCIDNLEKEIRDYGIKHNLNLQGINETISSIHSNGQSYRLSDLERINKTIEERKEKGTEIILVD